MNTLTKGGSGGYIKGRFNSSMRKNRLMYDAKAIATLINVILILVVGLVPVIGIRLHKDGW